MNILVIGCDQVGAALVRDLEHIGHDISLIEKDSEQLKRLDSFDDYSFGGTALVGDPTDPDVLKRGRLGEPDGGTDRQKHLPARKGHLPRLGPASASALPQGLRAGDHLPHHPHRTGRVPGTGKVRPLRPLCGGKKINFK